MVCPICRRRWAPSKILITGKEGKTIEELEEELFELEKIEICPDCAEDEF
jgi:hypothetical protein